MDISYTHANSHSLILDVRPEHAFLARHHPLAAHVPLDELADRVHELPKRHLPLSVYDSDPVRSQWACSRLLARGFEQVYALPTTQSDDWIVGPARTRLWQPHDLTVKACGIIRSFSNPQSARSSPAAAGDPQFLRALDLAAGSGRDAVYLAMNGWKVEAWDILPDALDKAADLARRNSVTIETRTIDLERDAWPTGEGFDLVTVFNYLHRPLIPLIKQAVRPDGWVVYETFVDPQIEMFGKPRRPEFVLRSGELRGYFADWEIHHYHERLAGPRRFAAGVVARRPA